MSSRLADPDLLVGYWPGNNHVEDVIHGNNGTWIGTEAYADGAFGRSVGYFNGSSNLSIPDNANLSFGDEVTDSPFSLSFWTIFDAVGSRGIIDKSSGVESPSEYLVYSTGASIFTFGCVDFDKDNRILRTISEVLVVGRLYHHVCTYDGSGASSGIKIYRNGVQAGDGTNDAGSYTAMHNTAAPLLIGKRLAFSTLFMNGKLWDVRIYNVALTALEAHELFRRPVPRG